MRISFIMMLLVVIVLSQFAVTDPQEPSVTYIDLAMAFAFFSIGAILFRFLISVAGLKRSHEFRYAAAFSIIFSIVFGIIIPTLVIYLHPNSTDSGWEYRNVFEFMGIYVEINQILGTIVISIPVYYVVELVRLALVRASGRLSAYYAAERSSK